MTEGEAARAYIRAYGYFRDCIVRNDRTVFGWEADILIFMADGRAKEVEIKVAASDLKKEFNRKNWEPLDAEGFGRSNWYHNWSDKERKHDALMNGGAHEWKRNREELRWDYIGRQPTPVSFYIVAVPKELADLALELVPKPYGINALPAVEGGSLRVVRKPVRIANSRPLNDKEMRTVAHHLSTRFWANQFGIAKGRR